MVLKGLLRLLLVPVVLALFGLDILLTAIYKVYIDSMVELGWFSRLCHWIVGYLMVGIRCWMSVKTCLSPIKRSTRLPPINSPLINLSAKQLAHSIIHRKVKCEDVVNAYIQRVKQVNPILNFVVEERYEEALKEAKLVDSLLTSRPDTKYWEKNKPLLGVPLTVKESVAVKGMSNASASCSEPGRRATEDAETVALLKKAGAIPIIVTTTPEYCGNWETSSWAHGVTCNPFDTRRSAGGSSGGEGSALGSGASVVGVGSDLAGSIRIPAFFHGIFAHKPTPGFIPIHGHHPSARDPDWENYFCIGPMTRYAEDLPLMVHSMIPERNKPARLRLDEPVDLKKVKFYFAEDLGEEKYLHRKPKAEVHNALMKAVHHFKLAYGVNVEKVTLGETDDILSVAIVLILALDKIENIYQKSEENPDDMEDTFDVIYDLFKKGRYPSLASVLYKPLKKIIKRLPPSSVQKVKERTLKIRAKLEHLLGDDGVLLLPSFHEPAPYHHTAVGNLMDISYMILFNMTQLPVTQCPITHTQEGLPIGVQIISSRYQDRFGIAAAKSIQEAFGGWKSPPTVK